MSSRYLLYLWIVIQRVGIPVFIRLSAVASGSPHPRSARRALRWTRRPDAAGLSQRSTRAKQYPMYFICHPLWIDLESPPIVTDAMLRSSLGQVPVVRTPTTWEREKVQSLLRKVGLHDLSLPDRTPSRDHRLCAYESPACS